MQQVIISLGAGAVRQVVGSNDLETVLAFSPDRLIKAVHDGEIEAASILKSTLEIDGRLGRLQAEGQPDYSNADGEQMANHAVMPEDPARMTKDTEARATANGRGKPKPQKGRRTDQGGR